MRGKKEDPGVARLAAEGFTATEIAEKLGISRQRVYKIASRDRIIFALRSRMASSGAQVRAPMMATGIIASGTVIAGTIAELLVAADLLTKGWNVYAPLVRNKGHDLIVYCGGKVLTIEVRSAYRSQNGKLVGNRMDRKDKSSHFAFVITGEPIVYEPELSKE